MAASLWDGDRCMYRWVFAAFEQKVWRKMWKPPFAGSTARRCALSMHLRALAPPLGCSALAMTRGALLREAIELHDSKVIAIVTTGSSARVVIQAYLHRSDGEPGTSPGSVWAQRAELRLDGVQPRHATPPALDVLDGFVEVAGRRHSNLVPLPFDVVGPVRVLLEGPQGVFEASATAAQFALVGEARYVEEFPGAGRRT